MEALSRAAEGIGPVKPGNLWPFESKGEKVLHPTESNVDGSGGDLKDEEAINDRKRRLSLFFQKKRLF